MATSSIVSYVLQRVREFLADESKLLYRVGDEVRELESALRQLHAFLIDAETKKHGNKTVQAFVVDIKEAVYDAEYVLDSYTLQVTSVCGTRNLINALTTLICCFREIISPHSVASDIERIKERIVKLRVSMQTYGVEMIMDAQGSNIWKEMELLSQSFGHKMEPDIVGIEHEIADLSSILVDEDRNVPIISISGMGGLGKTTLAKQIFHSSKVRGCFDKFAWVYVSQECHRRHVWRKILNSLQPDSNHKENPGITDEQISEELHEFLKSNKCLVVLDDVWRSEDWNIIRSAFPEETGSKLIITSRTKNVASRTSSRVLIYEPTGFSDYQSWEFLKKIVFSREDMSVATVNKRMEEVGKRLVNRCGGLPLAVRALAGILARKQRSSAAWLEVENNLESYMAGGSSLDQNSSSVLNVLSSSYDVLPDPLKACFLYMGHFPKDYEIDVDRLIKYWTAEGMVVEESLAELYLEELVKRSLVLVGRRDIANKKIKTCRLHDLIRDLCLSKAKDDIYLHFISCPSQTRNRNPMSSLEKNKVRRLGIHVDYMFEELKHLQTPRLRSLLLFKGSGYRIWSLNDPAFKNLRLLRVLDLESASFDGSELPEDIGELILLRYLSLRGSDVKSIPASIGNLKLLLTLDIRCSHPAVHVSNVLWKLRKLQHLYLPSKLTANTLLDIGCLVDLQTLENFPAGKCDVKALFGMTRLTTLSICILYGTIIPAELGQILGNLHRLTIHNDDDQADRRLLEPPVDGSELLRGFVNLYKLNLFTRIGKLPDARQLPQDITSITLKKCELVEDPMPILGKLLSLRVLKLLDDAFVSTTTVCCEESFLELVQLELMGLPFLQEWRIEDGSMPGLDHLTISLCQQLEMLPEGIRSTVSLQQLDIEAMPESFIDRLIQGGVDHYKIQHVPGLNFPSRHHIVK